jgi:hypothetical protein
MFIYFEYLIFLYSECRRQVRGNSYKYFYQICCLSRLDLRHMHAMYLVPSTDFYLNALYR